MSQHAVNKPHMPTDLWAAGWGFSVVVTSLRTSTKLLYARPG